MDKTKTLLFCYGTLRSARVMKAVTGREFPGRPATLHDYALYRVRGTEYPGIISAPAACVAGVLYRDIDDDSLRILDDFEGEQYFRNNVSVVTASGEHRDAFVYCIRDEQRHVLSEERWDFSYFLQHELERFMTGFVEARRDLYDKA
jgi:gamma-glutamylcyclotransferase (GGCT)/AIG2-like uncharacterized protein YtfP